VQPRSPINTLYPADMVHPDNPQTHLGRRHLHRFKGAHDVASCTSYSNCITSAFGRSFQTSKMITIRPDISPTDPTGERW
jgi:hypothetical protein